MAVHSTEVVLNKAGTAYITETEDWGTVTAVDSSAGTITVKEGTSSVTYATPTITIPSGATVTLDGKTSSLEKISSGAHVSIRSSSEGTEVFAMDSSFTPPAHGDGGPPAAPGAPGAPGELGLDGPQSHPPRGPWRRPRPANAVSFDPGGSGNRPGHSDRQVHHRSDRRALSPRGYASTGLVGRTPTTGSGCHGPGRWTLAN